MSQTEKDLMRRLLSLTRKAVQEYDMIKEGDRVCVGLSGGKDSMALLKVMANLQRFYPKSFSLSAVHVSLGFENTDVSPMERFCEELNVPLEIVRTDIAEIVFNIRKEQNPCSLCANLRRGALHDKAKETGANVVALAHHRDDVIETAMLSLFYEGRFYCFEPCTYLSRSDITVIRPFSLVEEKELKRYVSAADIPVVKNPCPMDTTSERAHMKEILKNIPVSYDMLKTNIFGAVKRGIWNRQDGKEQ